jgi:hypothetical protein
VLSSVTTSTWPALSPGTLSQYAYVYNLAADTVLVEADVNFDTNGVLTSGITHVAGTAGITLANSGTYKVTFSLSDTEPNQMALFVNGALVLGTIYGSEERRLIRTPLSPSRNSTRSRTRPAIVPRATARDSLLRACASDDLRAPRLVVGTRSLTPRKAVVIGRQRRHPPSP